jgi:hypothetical protein
VVTVVLLGKVLIPGHKCCTKIYVIWLDHLSEDLLLLHKLSVQNLIIDDIINKSFDPFHFLIESATAKTKIIHINFIILLLLEVVRWELSADILSKFSENLNLNICHGLYFDIEERLQEDGVAGGVPSISLDNHLHGIYITVFAILRRWILVCKTSQTCDTF